MKVELTQSELVDVISALAVTEKLLGFVRRTDQQDGAKEVIRRGVDALAKAQERARKDETE